MRQFSLYVICFVLFLCGSVPAQQGLVEYNEKGDPCALFKMRILVPENHADFKRQNQKLKDGIDPRMVWNPCPQPEPQFAFALVEPPPAQLGNLLAPRSFPFLTVKERQKKQAEFPFLLSPFSK